MSRYKTIGVWDSAMKKNTTRTFIIEGLTDEQINKKIKELKEAQKLKNLEYKQHIKKVILVDKLNNNNNDISVPISIPSPNINIQTDNVKQEKDLHLILNKNTGNTTFLLGSSQRGKSTTLMYLYDKYYSGNDFISFLFAINYQIKLYKKDKNLLICKTFNKQSEKLIQMQKYINSNCKNKYEFCNMFDDIIDQKYNKLLNNLILTYRNSNISSLISLQYPKMLNRNQRSNIHNVLLFGFNNDESIVDVIKYWLKSFFIKLGYKTEIDQINFYKKMTENYGFIYVSSLHNHISFHRLTI